MRAAIIIVGTVALVFAGGTGLLLSRALDKGADGQPAAGGEVVKPVVLTKVLVAADAVPVGKILDAPALTWEEWPETTASAAAGVGAVVGKTDEDRAELRKRFDGATVRVPLVRGQPVTEEMVILRDKGSTLSAVLTPGMRTFTVPVDTVSGVGGMIQPNDRVDVMLTTDLTDPGAGAIDPVSGKAKPRLATETIMRDVRVLSADRKLHVDTGTDIPPPTNVTLEVKPDQAERLATAAKMGKLSLTMRPLRLNGADGAAGQRPTTDLDVMRDLRSAREGKPVNAIDDSNPFKATAKPQDTVTIYRWNVPTTVTTGGTTAPVAR